MTLYVLTVENSVSCEVIGAYSTPKEAKAAAVGYVENSNEGVVYKKKQKKQNDEQKQLMYVQDSSEHTRNSIFMHTVSFELPKKQKKDPNAPKKPLSAFMIFSNEQRGRIKKENPEDDFGTIGKKIGQEWKALSEDEKSIYVEKAQKEKERYQSETSM